MVFTGRCNPEIPLVDEQVTQDCLATIDTPIYWFSARSQQAGKGGVSEVDVKLLFFLFFPPPLVSHLYFVCADLEATFCLIFVLDTL